MKKKKFRIKYKGKYYVLSPKGKKLLSDIKSYAGMIFVAILFLGISYILTIFAGIIYEPPETHNTYEGQ